MNLRSITSALLVGLCVLLGACASREPWSGPDYSTAYLGPDGTIIFGQRPASAGRDAAPRFAAPDADWTWNGDGVSGAPSMVINLSTQTATFYKGGQEVGSAPVSTGREGYRTPAGSFRITQKNADHISNLYGDYVDANGNVVVANVGVNRDKRPPGTRFRGAPMPYFMRIHGAVGLHAGYLPGYPASHGCIRLPKGAAATFFAHAPVGTPVRVTY
ncbi:MAG: L,D-transpeptidase [Terrimicrobiaceae bacterium]|nr:L,D-transpeptidase [Terrimicrobiaceae bacterium]